MFVRIYSGEDGQSHFEEIDPPMAPVQHSPPYIVQVQAATGIAFHDYSKEPKFFDWHTAPQSLYVIVLSGQIEFAILDGTVRTLGPGDVLFEDDTTGQGHTTRVVSNEPWMFATIPLAP